MRLFFARIALVGFCLSFIPTVEGFAHHGGDHPAWEIDEFDERRSFANGLAHPFTGLDHLGVMLAVGVLCVATRRWETGLVFGVAVGLGAATGSVSPGWILASTVGVIGILLLAHRRAAHVVQLFLVAFVGLIHGGVHGAILSGFGAGAGLFLGTALGMVAGAALACMGSSLLPVATRLAGTAVVVAGTSMTVAGVLSY